MKLIRGSGLLALMTLMALTAMAFVGVGSAMASTGLCGADELYCASPFTHVHETSVGKAILLASPKIECNVLFLGEVVGEGEAGQLEIEGNFTYTNCGSGCTVTEASASTGIEVERTGHETAKVVGEGEVHVNCIGINCYFNGKGLAGTAKGPLLATQKNGEVSVQEQTVHKTKGTFCPSTAKLDITTTPLSATYIDEGGGGLTATSTSLSTSLKGGGKEGTEITVAEGSKVKDTATLSGENASKATGTVDYAVYKDKECKELVTQAGKVTVKEGKVPDSEEKELEAGKEYFWQAKYLGDEMNNESTSTCSKEVLKVKAKVTLSTTLSGGGKEGAEITIAEEAEVKDQAILSGTNSSNAGGVIKYKVYKDKECKELVTSAGEGEVEKGKVQASSGVTLSAGVYYWQAIYEGDSLHEKSTGACGSEVQEVLPPTTLCKANETPCANAKIWPAGEIRTASELGVPSRFVLSFGGVEKKVKCAASVFEGEMFTRAAWPLRGKMTTMDIGSCEEDCLECLPCTVTTEDLPYYVEMDATGSGDGAMTMRIWTSGPPRMKIACIGFTCIYETASLAALEASIEGGEPATLVVNTSLDKLQFGSTEGCGPEVHWTAKDNFTKPNEGVNKMWVVRDGV